jgi:hypothetical protein
LVIFGGGGLLLYIILWIALPEEPFAFYQEPQSTTEGDQQEPASAPQPVVPTTRNNGALIGGLIMIGIGLVFLIDRFIPRIHFGDFWPVLIVIAGIALIISSFNGFNRKSA